MDPDVRRRVEAACAEGGSSIHATGSSPGFISEALPIVLLTMARRLDRLQIDEFADMSSRDSPELLFDLMAFGGDPAAFDARRFGHLAHAFGPSLSALADAIGLPIDAIESSGEVAVAAHDIEIAAGTVEAGTVAAQRPIVTALRDGEPLLQFRANWYLTTDVEPAWDLRETGLAGAGAGRHTHRPGDPVPRRPGALRPGVARLHRAPRGQRRGHGVRGRAGHPDHLRPPEGHSAPRMNCRGN